MLHLSNYHYNKGPVCYVLPFYNQHRYGELSILFLFILFWDTPAYVYSLLLSIILWWFYYFYRVYSKLLRKFSCLANIESVYLLYFQTLFLHQKNKSSTFNYQSPTTGAETKFLLTRSIKNWKMKHYHGFLWYWLGRSSLILKSPGFR